MGFERNAGSSGKRGQKSVWQYAATEDDILGSHRKNTWTTVTSPFLLNLPTKVFDPGTTSDDLYKFQWMVLDDSVRAGTNYWIAIDPAGGTFMDLGFFLKVGALMPASGIVPWSDIYIMDGASSLVANADFDSDKVYMQIRSQHVVDATLA